MQTAQAHQKILEKQVQMLKNTVDTLEYFILPSSSATTTNHKSTAVKAQQHGQCGHAPACVLVFVCVCDCGVCVYVCVCVCVCVTEGCVFVFVHVCVCVCD